MKGFIAIMMVMVPLVLWGQNPERPHNNTVLNQTYPVPGDYSMCKEPEYQPFFGNLLQSYAKRNRMLSYLANNVTRVEDYSYELHMNYYNRDFYLARTKYADIYINPKNAVEQNQYLQFQIPLNYWLNKKTLYGWIK